MLRTIAVIKHLYEVEVRGIGGFVSLGRQRGGSGGADGGLGGAGETELQLQRRRVDSRRKALQRKLQEVGGCHEAHVSDCTHNRWFCGWVI